MEGKKGHYCHKDFPSGDPARKIFFYRKRGNYLCRCASRISRFLQTWEDAATLIYAKKGVQKLLAPLGIKRSEWWVKLVNAVWSVLITYAITKGIDKITNALVGTAARSLTSVKTLLERGYTPNAKNVRLTADDIQWFVEQPVMQRFLAFQKSTWKAFFIKFRPWQEQLKMLWEVGALRAFKASAWLNYLRAGLYIAKAAVGGLMSPTEWVELIYFIAMGKQWGFDSELANFMWNWGDSLFFLWWFTEETTIGMFKAIFIGTQGDYSYFADFGW